MTPWATDNAWKKGDAHTNFLNHFIDQGRAPNLIVVIDTHSDSWSGQLQTAGGSGGEHHLTLLVLLQNYVGGPVMDRMAASSTQARHYNTVHEISPGVAPWADITPKTRGGWKVVIMPVCGSTVTQVVNWNYLVQAFAQ